MEFSKTLDQLRESGNFRTIPDGHPDQLAVDFTSNDYLGLGSSSTDFPGPAFHAPMTASASRLLASRQDEYTALEDELARLYGRSVLLFNSGYHANTGMISALADRHTIILADRLVHASIIDGILLSRASMLRFPHNDLDALEHLLSTRVEHGQRVIVVVESVYSMDGDRPDMLRLADIKRRYPQMLLYVDEAHAFGCCGPSGLGVVMEHPDAADAVDVIIGTFGKAAASVGAFAAMSEELRHIAVNCARSFIFSTALPPANIAWTLAMVRRITQMDEARTHLALLASRLAKGLAGLPGSAPEGFASHIYPLIVGDSSRAVELSRLLRLRHQLVLPIRTPTVPAGTERLRISLSAAHSIEQVDTLVDTLRELIS